MDVLDQLHQMVIESDNTLPFKRNNVRSDLDFHVMPNIVYSDPNAFVQNCIYGREKFICELFNMYYKSANTHRHSLEPKIFQPTDFYVYHKSIDKIKNIIYIMLPNEFAESLDFCRTYVLTYRYIEEKVQSIVFSTIEDSMYGWQTLGIIKPTGEHTRLARSSGNIEDDIQTICGFTFT